MRKFCRVFLYSLISLILLIWLLFYLVTSPQPAAQRIVRATDVSTAHQLLSDTAADLAQPGANITLRFNQSQLDALLNVASFALPQVQFTATLSPFGLALRAEANLPLQRLNRSVQAACLLAPSATGFAIDYCKLGHIFLPGWVANQLLKHLLNATLVAPAPTQLLALLATGEIKNQQLHFTRNNISPINLQLLPQFYPSFSNTLPAQPQALEIAFYLSRLEQLQRQYKTERRMAFFAHHLLLSAAQRDQTNTQGNEVKTALWALAVAFANNKFIYYANPAITPRQIPKMPPMLLNGRHDLTLHFLYSAVLQMLGSSALSEQVGTLKEIMDADKGGSGFSFVDLTADRAGTAFAEQLPLLTLGKLRQFNAATFERAIMPTTQNLPEGLTEQQVKQRFGGYNSESFKQMEQEIMTNVRALSLYDSPVETPINVM